MLFSEVLQIAKEILFPRFCVGCRRSGSLLCEACWSKVQFVYDLTCPVCQHPSIGGLTHPRCRSAWGMDGLYCVAYYRGPVRSLVRQLKYAGATVTEELIEQLMVYYFTLQQAGLSPAVITAVPMDYKSRKARGFNQAEVIAEVLSRQTGYPYISGVLERKSQSVSQTKLSRAERQINMRGAFGINKEIVEAASVDSLKNSAFIVVDDVFTTGATLREAAKVLKRSGAKRVVGFTLAQD